MVEAGQIRLVLNRKSKGVKKKKIRKAYRQKALKYHPNKNPDNPRATKLFRKLSKAVKTLTDPNARYEDITGLALSSKKKDTAIVRFQNKNAAVKNGTLRNWFSKQTDINATSSMGKQMFMLVLRTQSLKVLARRAEERQQRLIEELKAQEEA
ncbi:PREDICTED: dnaJ homolog subfamily C member 17-like [Wasmannia auropunctata]|uniref:dnaJ homolog subfamily C member 17-like n=1 Tax=Wasmannia auropunctata TaxID=64793 RepID=UPI0005EDE161|nr:PREDICTED: dnaJ homolog subfamily C member 17-like [Wasmannia auropunctata]